jgi:hypothetical protein
MKTKIHHFAMATVLFASVLNLSAADKKPVGGPKGGRLLENAAPRAEFFVEKDHTVTITFYDADLKPVPVSEQSVSVIAEAKEGKTKLEFEKKGDLLVSKGKLPEGDGYNLVVQVKQAPEAKPQNFRIKFDQKICNECKRPEYACICGD